MLQTSTRTYQTGLPLRLLELPEAVDVRSDEHVAVRRERQTEVAMDDALAASFPASDPPAWNPGIARPIPVDASPVGAHDVRPSAPHEIAGGLRASSTCHTRTASSEGCCRHSPHSPAQPG